jgi:hypothetical protein
MRRTLPEPGHLTTALVLVAEEVDKAEAAVAVVEGARVSPASAGPVAKLATSKTPVTWRNATRIRCTGHMGVGLYLRMME